MTETKDIIFYGADWCPDCRRVKSIFDDNGVSYVFKNVDDGKSVEDEMLALTDQKYLIPTLKIGDKVVQNPTNEELMKLLNIKQSASKSHDVVMIGAGPAALSAAVYTTREDIDTVLFERAVIGGLAAVTDQIDNYPGFADGIDGLKLAEQLQKQAERFGAQIELGEVTGLKKDGDFVKLETTDGEYQARAVLIATGSDYKKIGVPGEKEYYARGVHYCATCDGAFYRDKKLVVVGGGNSAFQEAIFLTRFASHIDLLVRSTAKASDVLQKDMQKYVDDGKVTIHLATTTKEIVGDDGKVTKVIGEKGGKPVEFDTDGVFVFVGLSPNTEFLKNTDIELDDIGLIKTNDKLQTTLSGVFAAGDVRSGATMQIASATGEGATAALIIREYLDGKLAPKSESTETVEVPTA